MFGASEFLSGPTFSRSFVCLLVSVPIIMGVPLEYRNELHVSLIGRDNETYRGTLVLKNWTLQYPGSLFPVPEDEDPEIEDPTGASYYVIAVVLVYGMSIVALIASHIKRNHQKLEQDKQIHKYFQEFMVVKETSSREAYRKLKKSIVKKLMWENNPTYRSLQRAILPSIAVVVGGPLLTLTSEQELDALRRDRRSSSPAPSVIEQSASVNNVSGGGGGEGGGGGGGRKQRRKGLGNLFTPAPARDFEMSVLEQLAELKDFRQEVRARANSVAFSNNSSFDVSGLRNSEIESGSESNMDNQSEDSHITLPAITLRGPSPDPLATRGRSPLPTIADTEDSMHRLSDDEDGVVEEDHDEDDDDEDIWLMSDNMRDNKHSHHPSSHPRRVRFSTSTQPPRHGLHVPDLHNQQSRSPSQGSLRTSLHGSGSLRSQSPDPRPSYRPRSSIPSPPPSLQLVRQDNVVGTDSENDVDEYGFTDSDEEEEEEDDHMTTARQDEELHKITCV